MKKKLCLGAAVLLTGICLTACGNPLKELPDTAEGNQYENYTTGNEIMDEALTSLKKNDAVKGVISSVVLYDRQDDTENKDRSDIYVRVESSSSLAEYVNCYALDFLYTKETGWHLKDYVRDETESSSVTPKENLTEEQVKEDMAEQAPSTSVFDGDVTLDFSADLNEAEILSESIKTSETDLIPTDTLEAKFVVDGGYCTYEGTAEMTYKFYETSEVSGWVLEEITVQDDVERVLTNDSQTTFAKKKQLNIICSDDIQIGNRIFTITEDNIESSEFEDCVFKGNTCTRKVTLVLKTGPQMPITLEAVFHYTYSSSGWKLDEVERNLKYERPNLIGEYSGEIYNSIEEMEAGEESIGKAYYSILEQDEDGNISGAIRYLNDGQEVSDVEPIYFKANYYENNMTWTVIFVSDVDDKNYGFNYEDLVFDPFTGDLVIDRRTHYYRLVLK